MTTRQSSLWDRLNNINDLGSIYDETSAWYIWLSTDFPAAVAKNPDGSWVDTVDTKRNWGINTLTLANLAWAYARGAFTTLQFQETFSLSALELAQVDAINSVVSSGGGTAQVQKWLDLSAEMYGIEQELLQIVSADPKADFYTKYGIPADGIG